MPRRVPPQAEQDTLVAQLATAVAGLPDPDNYLEDPGTLIRCVHWFLANRVCPLRH